MIRQVVFDMGNVILDYRPLLACYRHSRSWEKAHLLCDAIFRAPQWAKNIDGGLMTDEEYARDAQSRLESDALKALVPRILKDWWHDGIYLKAGMDALIAELLDRGVGLYILSNVGFCFHQLAYKIPYIDRFSGIMLSSEEKLIKPDPAFFRRLCARYGLAPEECLFIDDLAHNVEGAQSIGMQGYTFEDGDVNRLRAHLRAVTG